MTPLDRIESKLDKLTDTVTEQAVTLAKNTASLVEHMRRSDMLEKQQAETRAAVLPIQKHVAMVEGALKAAGVVAAVFGALGAAAAVVEGVLHVLEHFRGVGH